MTNPLRGEAELACASGRLRLVFDVEALVLAETALGETTDAMLTAIEAETVDLRRARALLWGAMQRHHAGPIEAASRKLEEAGYAAAKAAILAGLLGAFGAAEGRDGSDPRRRGHRSDGWSFSRAIARWAAVLNGSGARPRG